MWSFINMNGWKNESFPLLWDKWKRKRAEKLEVFSWISTMTIVNSTQINCLYVIHPKYYIFLDWNRERSKHFTFSYQLYCCWMTGSLKWEEEEEEIKLIPFFFSFRVNGKLLRTSIPFFFFSMWAIIINILLGKDKKFSIKKNCTSFMVRNFSLTKVYKLRFTYLLLDALIVCTQWPATSIPVLSRLLQLFHYNFIHKSQFYSFRVYQGWRR